MTDTLQSGAESALDLDVPADFIDFWQLIVEHGQFDGAHGYGVFYERHAKSLHAALARRATAPHAGRLKHIALPDGESLRYEARTTGAPGWLLYDDEGKLVKALSLTDVAIIEATIAATRAAQPVEAAGAVQADPSQITDTESARKFIDAWHRKHFPTDRTFSRYIMADRARSNALAGDFAWQLAKALESMAASQPASQACGDQVASVEFNSEHMGHLINRLSVANRRDGWKGAAPEYSNADRERAAQAVEIAERNLLEYVRSLAAPATGAQVARAEPGPWQVFEFGQRFKSGAVFDVVLKNGVTEYGRTVQYIDWTQVADWRYAAPTESAAAPTDPDAERYRWLKANIAEGYLLPGSYYLPDGETNLWDRTIDAAMRDQKGEIDE